MATFNVMKLEEHLVKNIIKDDVDSFLTASEQAHIKMAALLELSMTGSQEYVQTVYDEIMTNV